MSGLSQCMIVKNEEANIERALSWGVGLVDEQIVVDTGSTDRTVEIARSMGAKVFRYTWDDDFAGAKNYAVSQASGKWIAFLDADEYFEPGDAKKIPELLKELSPEQVDGLMVSMIQLDGEGGFFAGGSQARIFANREDICYRRRIHEQLIRKDGKPLHLRDSTKELCVIHTGYRKDEKLQALKGQRNLRMILWELEDNPKDYEMLGYLGDIYFSAEQLDKAQEAYQKAVRYMPPQTVPGDQRSAMTFLNLISIADHKNEGEERMKEILSAAFAREELRKDADFDYLAARWYLARGQFQEALPFLIGTIDKMEKYGNFNRALYAAAHVQEIFEQTALCCLKEGKLQEAVSQAAAVLQEDPWSFAALTVLAEGFYKGNVEVGQAEEFLSRFYDRSSLKSRIFLLRAAGKAGWKELEERFRRHLSAEELACFDRSVLQ